MIVRVRTKLLGKLAEDSEALVQLLGKLRGMGDYCVVQHFDNSLFRVFYMPREGVEFFRSNYHVLTFDGTFKLERQKFIFFLMHAVDNQLRTVTMAIAMFAKQKESAEDVEFAFQHFREAVGREACNKCEFAICDQDCSLRFERLGPSAPSRWSDFSSLPKEQLFPPSAHLNSCVFDQYFPNAKLMLCSWHIRDRIVKEIRKAFAGEHVKKAEELYNIYERSSSPEYEKLAGRLYQLVEYALQHGRDTEKKRAFIQYLSRTEWPRHSLHVFAFTASTPWSFKMRSSQRAESSNG